MKNRIYMFILLMPLLVAGACDSLFDKGDVEKVYDGPAQVAFFPLEDNNNVGISTTSTTLEIQYIATEELATSTPISFIVTGTSTAVEGEHFTFGTPSPVTLDAGSWTTDIVVNFIVSTLDEISVSADTNLTAGTYTGVAATGGSPTQAASFNVDISAEGDPTVTIVDGGYGYTSADNLVIPAASLGGGADLPITIDELTGSWVNSGASEVLLQLGLEGGSNVMVAANMDTSNVYMY